MIDGKGIRYHSENEHGKEIIISVPVNQTSSLLCD